MSQWLTWLPSLTFNTTSQKRVFAGVKVYNRAYIPSVTFFPDADCPSFSNDGKTIAMLNKSGQLVFFDLPLLPGKSVFLLFGGTAAVLAFAALRLWVRWRNVKAITEAAPLSASEGAP